MNQFNRRSNTTLSPLIDTPNHTLSLLSLFRPATDHHCRRGGCHRKAFDETSPTVPANTVNLTGRQRIDGKCQRKSLEISKCNYSPVRDPIEVILVPIAFFRRDKQHPTTISSQRPPNHDDRVRRNRRRPSLSLANPGGGDQHSRSIVIRKGRRKKAPSSRGPIVARVLRTAIAAAVRGHRCQIRPIRPPRVQLKPTLSSSPHELEKPSTNLDIPSPVYPRWRASLFKILHSSFGPSEEGYFCNGGTFNKTRRNVLLVVAHPDDESMFFSPTISYLTSRGYNLHVLCLSIGDADGKGNIRKEELYLACTILKVPRQQVRCLDHAELQDGFGKVWNHNLLAKIIEEEVTKHGIDLIITFDGYGVSGHCNHCDVHHGVRKLLHNTSQQDIEAWGLVSTNLLRKYSGPVDIWLSYVCAFRCSGGVTHCLINEHPRKSFLAMAQHSSQWVWFRKLFVTFSSYTYVNTLRRIN